VSTLERFWPQAQEHPARVFQTCSGEFAGPRQAFQSVLSFDSLQAANCRQMEQNTRELLSHGIMDLARQPVAFFQDRRTSQSICQLSQAPSEPVFQGGPVALRESRELMLTRFYHRAPQHVIGIAAIDLVRSIVAPGWGV
jgi:hypothetical protein